MNQFRVWAPKAKQVRLCIDDREHAMSRAADGWWVCDEDGAIPEPGVDYAFRIDDGKPLPDPRSRYQPRGVHGPSRVVDPAGFDWHDEGFRATPLASAIIYEMHIGTFTPDGTLDSAIEQLDHLVELGITHVELLPVNAFAGDRGWGYDGVGLFAVHAAYGGPEALARFVDAAHARGLAVLLDVVYNHLGPEGNYLAQFGPYFNDKYSTPWGPAVNYDEAGSAEVRRFVIDNALMWLRDYHIDGLRVDAVHAIYDISATHVLESLNTEVQALAAQVGRPLCVIAESDLNNPATVRHQDAGGMGFDAQWSDDFHHALHALLTGEDNGYYRDFGSIADLAKAMQDAFVYDGRYSAHRDRVHGRPATGLNATRFLAYAQNHDQVGNRATGDRLIHQADAQRAKIAAALVMVSPYIPMLFMGEEWGASSPFQFFSSFEDPGLDDAVREGRRREFSAFGWKPEDVPDPQDPATFERSKLKWQERDKPEHHDLLTWHKQLIALRQYTPALADGRRDRVRCDFDEAQRWLRIERGNILTAVNFGSDEQTLALPRAGRLLLDSAAGTDCEGNAVVLSPISVAIIHLKGSS